MDLEVGRITGKFSNKKYMRLIKKKNIFTENDKSSWDKFRKGNHGQFSVISRISHG